MTNDTVLTSVQFAMSYVCKTKPTYKGATTS